MLQHSGLGTGCRSHIDEQLSSVALFIPGQKIHPHVSNWDLVIPDGTGVIDVVFSPFLM